MDDAPDLTPEEVTYDAVLAVQASETSGMAPAEMGKAFERAFGRIGEYIQTSGAHPLGPPRAIYTGYTPTEIEFTVAIPLASGGEGGNPDGSVVVDELAGGKAIRFVHTGPYEKLRETYGEITTWMIGQGMMESEADWVKYSPMWEEYVNDPTDTPAEELKTRIYVPVS